VGLLPFACWECGFERRRGHGCLSVASVACCQVEFAASGYHLCRGVLPSVMCVKKCDRDTSIIGPGPLGAVAP
jgi:hypothetical protein